MPSLVFFVMIALLPGIVAWWTGRRLARATDDPALPELLLARRQRITVAIATSISLMIVFGGRSSYWGLPLMAVAMLAGSYSFRRRLALETGPFGGYLWRGVKSIVGGLGFWVLLVVTPQIVLAIDPRYQAATLALIVLLLVWEEWYADVWLRLHDAAPLVDGRAQPLIDAIVVRAGIAPPALYAIGRTGTRLVNAFAFPSLRRPSIAFGAAILELLEPEEVAAIYAHELSHIEQHGPRRLRRQQEITRLLIVLAVGLPLVGERLVPGSGRWVSLVWPVVVLGAVIARSRTRQRDETESDLRAAALCGDPEVVARALVKVYVHGLIPRRWPIDFERRASHPSLARRIQALRGESGAAAAATPSAPIVLPTARAGSVVVFDDARAYWLDGVPPETAATLASLRDAATSARSVAWPELVELRVATQGAGRALRATLRNGDTWQVPLEGSQVAAVQQALDRVDTRLNRELGSTPGKAPRLIAALIVVAMLVSFDVWLLFLPAVLALVRPSTAALAALGTMAAARAGVVLATDKDFLIPGVRGLGLVVLGLLGVLAIVTAARRARSKREPGGERLTVLVVGGLAALLVVAAVVAARDLSLGEINALPIVPALAVTLLGLAAALATGARRNARWAAGAVLASAIVVGSGTAVVGRRLSRAAGMSRAKARAIAVTSVDLGAGATSLRLSPAATRVLVQRYDARGSADRAARLRGIVHHVLASFDGRQRAIDALQVEFLDDEHVLALRRRDDGFELRLERADRDSVLWSTTLSSFDEAKLVVSPNEGRWAVVGTSEESDSLVVVSGTAQSPATTTHRFTHLDSLIAVEHLVFDGGSTLLLPIFRARTGASMPLAMFGLYPLRAEVWRLTATERRRVATMDGFPTCGQPDRGHTMCFTRRRNGGAMWMLDPNGLLTSLGELHGADAARVTLGPGLHATFAHGTDQVTDVDGDARRITDVRLPSAPGYVVEARASAGRIAVLRNDAGASHVTLYRVE